MILYYNSIYRFIYEIRVGDHVLRLHLAAGAPYIFRSSLCGQIKQAYPDLKIYEGLQKPGEALRELYFERILAGDLCPWGLVAWRAQLGGDLKALSGFKRL